MTVPPASSSLAPPASSAPLPATVGPYRVLRLLGSGGMGRVYLAATRGGRPVAVKTVRESYAQDPHFRERFRAEAEAAFKVSGAFTAPVLAADPDAALPWLATAYLPAPSLSDAVTAHGALPEPMVRALAVGLAEALAAIHAAGLVHRDLKPSNILLTEDGPRVIDFGIARAVDAAGLTAPGQILGTAGYMPPEQISGRTCTAAGDVFSLGATLVFAAAGRGAFGSSGLHILQYRTVYEEPDLEGTPEALREPLAACLAKEPWQRPHVPQLAALFGAPPLPGTGWLPEAVRRDVRRREETVQEELANAPSGWWGRRRVIAAAGGGIAAAAFGGWYFTRGDTSGTHPDPPQVMWRKQLPDGFTKVWSAARGRVLLSDSNGAGAAAVDPDTGRTLWQSKPYGPVPSTTDGHTVYAVELDGAVHARDLATGARRWRFAPPGTGSPEAADLVVRAGGDGWTYVTSAQTRGLYGLDGSGKVRWHREAPLTTVYPRGKVVLCVTRPEDSVEFRRTVHALDARSGKKLWSYPADIFGVGKNPGTRMAVVLRHDTAELAGLRLSDGRPLWTVPTGLDLGDEILGEVLADSALLSGDGSTVILQQSLTNGSFAALDAGSGTTLWRGRPASAQQLMPFGTTLFTSASPPAGTYHTAGRGPLTAYSLRSGHRLWRTADLDRVLSLVLAARAGLVLLGITGGSHPGLYGYALSGGKRVWGLPYEGDIPSVLWTAASSGNRTWVSSGTTLLCLKQAA